MDFKDDEVDRLLTAWNLKQYIDKFREEEIDKETLLLLSEASAASLIGKIGPRTRLLNSIRIHKLKEEQVQGNSDLPHRGHPSNSVASTTSSVRSQPSTSTISLVNSEEDFDFDPEDEHDSDTDNVINKEQDVDVLDYCPSIEDLVKKTVHSDVEKALLARKTEGLRILRNYPASNRVSKKRRNKTTVERVKDYIGLDLEHVKLLCDIIVKEDLKDNCQRRATTARVGELADQIVALFRREQKSKYYIPFRSIKSNGKVVKKQNPRGRLFFKYTNYLKDLRKEGIRQTTRPIDVTCNAVIRSNVEESLSWLEKRVEICHELPNVWQQTRDARIAVLRNAVDCSGSNYLHDYIHKKYPFLKQPQGCSLLEADFDALYPDKKYLLFSSWDNFTSNLRRVAEVPEESELGDAEIFHLIASVFEDEGICSVPVTRKYRAGKDDMLQAFLCHVTRTDDIKPEIEAIEKKASKHRVQVQPYAIVVGQTLKDICESYVWYDGVQQRVDSPRDAIDKTFKIIHALHANYPRQSECYWLFVQKAIYKLNTPWDRVYLEVDSLIENLSLN